MAEPVLICGGGIGGLTAAVALGRAGIPSVILERASEFSEAGAGIEIGPNASRRLFALGLKENLSSFASEPLGTRVRDGLAGEHLTTIPLRDLVWARYDAPYLTIHRKHLQFCLLEAAGSLDTIAIETGFALADWSESTSGVAATSADGRTIEGRALVGADGLWSTVREQLFGVMPEPSGVTAWRTLVDADLVPESIGAPYIGLWLGPHGHVIHYPVDGDRQVSLVAMIEETINFDGWASPGKPDDLLPFFDRWDEALYDLLQKPESWHKWTVMRMNPLEQWSRGLVTLIGDAAHPIEPFMAQGGATAIEDAAVLSECVAEHEDNLELAFRTYESRRQARATRVQKASERRGRVYHNSGLMRWARNRALRREPSEKFLTRYDWLYEVQSASRAAAS